MTAPLGLRLLPGRMAVWRCAPEERDLVTRVVSELPDPEESAAGDRRLLSVTWTADEISIVCPEPHLPGSATAERGYRALEVEGPLDFALTGVLAGLAALLARAEVPIFVVSTYDTDYVLVPERLLERAIGALESGGHRIARAAT